MGCVQSPKIAKTNNIELPTLWHNSSTNNISYETNKEWWKEFNDKNLDHIIAETINNNSSMVRAGYRLQQASLATSLQNTNSFPQLSGSVNLNESRNLNNGDIGRGFGTSLNAQYIVDLWGNISKATNIKEWEMMATEQDLEATKLAIIGQAVQTYWQQAYINEKIGIANENLAKAKKVQRLIDIRYKAGASSRLDLLMANKTILTNEASLQKLLQEKEVASNSMAILLDVPPHSKLIFEPSRFPLKSLSHVSANIPATALSNRPDIKAAEFRIEKAISGIDVAKTNFYPTFNLTGSLGTSSTALQNIVSNPVGSLALGIALPFLNWNVNSINLSISKVAYEDVKTDYKQKVLNALAEVENSLNANEKYALEGKALLKSMKNAQQQEELYAVRYRAGASNLKEWLDAGDVTRNAKLAYVENQYRQYINRVNLYIAMGGA
jgi:NodT family efflux transporter outer membrane factor (OMF) lipoprotein